MYGMSVKTTIYFSDEMKASIEVEARRRGCSEAQVIRDAVAAVTVRPQPRPGILDAEPVADRVDKLLAGFGQR